jgi:uncharacterized protein YndB with AHSA1/START domain
MTDVRSADAGAVTFTVRRTFEAPRERVFAAWSEEDQLARWWGPKGMKIDIRRLEFRPGGIFHYRMGLPNGDEWWGRFVYREIVRPERIVFVNAFADAEGNVVRAPFSAVWPLETLSTVTFTEAGGQTTMTLVADPLTDIAAERDAFRGMNASMTQGWNATIDQLAAHLAKG